MIFKMFVKLHFLYQIALEQILITILCIGTNDAFVTIGLGKEKFQTSVKEKSENPEWLEQCEL